MSQVPIERFKLKNWLNNKLTKRSYYNGKISLPALYNTMGCPQEKSQIENYWRKDARMQKLKKRLHEMGVLSYFKDKNRCFEVIASVEDFIDYCVYYAIGTNALILQGSKNFPAPDLGYTTSGNLGDKEFVLGEMMLILEREDKHQIKIPDFENKLYFIEDVAEVFHYRDTRRDGASRSTLLSNNLVIRHKNLMGAEDIFVDLRCVIDNASLFAHPLLERLAEINEDVVDVSNVIYYTLTNPPQSISHRAGSS